MEFRCFNGTNNCDYCGSCHSEFKVRTSDEKRRIYNKALDDMANKIKEYSGEHYLDCDGYGCQTELVFRTEEFLDDILNELKK